MGMTKDVFDEYGNYKFPDYSNSQYTHDVSTTGGVMMGMTIDKAISWIISISEHEGEDIPIYDTDVEAIKTAVSTMRKYQKIEEIINNAKDSDGAIRFNWLYERIKEVLEDGKID